MTKEAIKREIRIREEVMKRITKSLKKAKLNIPNVKDIDGRYDSALGEMVVKEHIIKFVEKDSFIKKHKKGITNS